MTIFEFAVVLVTAPAIATLCYGAYLSHTGKDLASAPRVSKPSAEHKTHHVLQPAQAVQAA